MNLVLVSGFLGSGKTTAIQQACRMLLKEGKRVAVITNDQGEELVDSRYLESESVPVKEVTKGCFCCNYHALLQNINGFVDQVCPDIIFAESVGSCTDLVATVAKPLAATQPELNLTISVFADASLLHSLITGAASFIDDSVRYIYKKQLEEADFLVINKADLLDPEQLKEVEKVMRQEHGIKRILVQNSYDERDIRRWMDHILHTSIITRRSLDIDYELYGAGEAKLAWLDAKILVQTQKMSALKASQMLAQTMYNQIKEQQLTIGHLKYFIDDGTEQQKISYTASLHEPVVSLEGRSNKASVLINARVQTEPDILKQILETSIDKAAMLSNSQLTVESFSAFQPAFPKPTHRIPN